MIKMTAAEMSEKLKYATLRVHFAGGHVESAGKVRRINQTFDSVWVGSTCINSDTVVEVDNDMVTCHATSYRLRPADPESSPAASVPLPDQASCSSRCSRCLPE
jgi:hypothetical protein